MTQIPATFKEIAKQHDLELHPTRPTANGTTLESHVLTFGRKVVAHYRNYQLAVMPEADFRAVCERLTTPAESEDTSGFWAAEYEQRQPRRSLVTGRYKPVEAR